MNTKALLLERIQEELYVRDIIREALNYTFIINENEDFTGKQISDNEFVWDVNTKQTIIDKAKKYFNKIKDKYNSATPNVKNRIKKAALISFLGAIGLGGGLDSDLKADTTDVNKAKEEINIISDKILPKSELKHQNKNKILDYNTYILATTLVGEAGGDGEAGMKAVANVLNNRAKDKDKSPAEIALEPKQFSMWNSHTVDGNDVKDVYNMYVTNVYGKNSSTWNKALKIAKNINNLSDNTDGARYYYNPDDANPEWGEELNDKWKTTLKVGGHIFGNVD
jgi:hypothetical protein